MNLADQRLKQLADPSLAEEERVLLRCEIAADLTRVGRHEAACEVLGELWGGVGVRPDVSGLSDATAAEVLWRCGSLSGWLGASRQIADAQAKAKDLLSESAELFLRAGDAERAAAARSELGFCYLREGGYDEARVVLEQALSKLRGSSERAKAILRLTTVEFSSGRHNDALAILTQNAGLFDNQHPALRGSYRDHLALVLKQLGNIERRPEYFDRAIIEFTAAIYHYEEGGHERYAAATENNLAHLLGRLGRYEEAHDHLNHARSILARLQDKGLRARVDETRARVFLAEQKYREANRVIADAIQTLERGGASAVLADAYTVQGVIWARLGAHESSIAILRRALRLGEESGALANAGLAALTLVEEHADWLSQSDAVSAYQDADRLLKDVQDSEVITRLRACARLVMRRLSETGLHDEGFILQRAVHEFEARFIAQALREAQGSVTRAAKLLGMKRHQTLGEALRTRHKNLLDLKTSSPKRRKSIIRTPRAADKPSPVKPASILLVEDNKLVAGAVRDTLEDRGWAVSMCADGGRALQEIEGDAPYTLFLFDYDLPHVNGIELVRRVRRLPHRRRTPTVMFTAAECERAAWLAGVDAFLRKPDDVARVADTIARLLPARRGVKK